MATYTYTCGECQNVFQLHATLEEKEAGKSERFICPKCQSKNIKPTFSVTNFIKNIFQNDGKTGSCCSESSSCCASDKKAEKNGFCGDKKDHGGCCSSKK